MPLARQIMLSRVYQVTLQTAKLLRSHSENKLTMSISFEDISYVTITHTLKLESIVSLSFVTPTTLRLSNRLREEPET